MFFHRLKYEFIEHGRMVAAYWAIQIALVYFALTWWFGDDASESSMVTVFTGLLWLAFIVTTFALVILVFKRDDLKCPRAFWATRPIRAKTLFAAKAVFVVLTVLVAYWLETSFELPRLDWRFLPIGVLALWILSALAVLEPARRAASVPPAVATRSV